MFAVAFVVFFLLTFGLLMLVFYLKFSASDYQEASGNPFLKTILDKGNYGEYLTFVALEKLKFPHKLLTNIYIEKEDGKTTEVDLVMLSEWGVYVIESKNYSGWIFGNEKNRNWTQSLPNRRKYRFYNPIRQNQGHIRAIKHALGTKIDDIFTSYIIFSKRCQLKKITVTSPHVKVLNRQHLARVIKRDIKRSEKILSQKEVDQFYRILKEGANADDAVKSAHIAALRAR
ncbi:uncharacterized protein JNUCC1_01575 [Lentibacillus sp. JNUCC-1]|uniref:nuclease-related domain-containing protein n=1 Tax=Lentibacillus sp. JNUCC-1 TaxID=2654513 RepID=UPI0012E943BF|nr:nuclease-related domain-containing protein [Lentibacillus sp. JNUCC-1]MUV37769.1 uncharacterized protein [Lentibacillus sp. JNUCC-1]